MKARLWLVPFVLLFVLLLVAGSPAVPATLAQGPTYAVYLPLVQASPAVQVLSNYLVYQTHWGSLHIVGEVENSGAVPITFVKVTVDFYDANHYLMANNWDFADLDVLAPGDKSCFDVVVPDPSYASFEFERPSYHTTTPRVLNLTLVDPSASYNASTGAYRIIGLVRNDGAVRVNSVDITGTAYNAAGTVVGCSSTSVAANLGPGQSSWFTLGFSDRNEADVASWRLQLDGSPQ